MKGAKFEKGEAGAAAARRTVEGRGPAELMRTCMELVRAALYPETRGGAEQDYREREVWFRDEKLVRQAVAWPAKEMRDRGWCCEGLGFDDLYLGMVREALKKVKLHGLPVETLRSRAAYFMKVLQDEFRHNWDRYWEAGKTIAAMVERARAELVRRGETLPAGTATLDVLAEAHAISAQRKGKPGPRPKAARQAAAGEIQKELF